MWPWPTGTTTPSQSCTATATAASARRPTSPWAASRWRSPSPTSTPTVRPTWWPSTAALSNNVAVLHNDGHGAFAIKKFSAGDQPTSVVVADFNDDGRLDLAVANLFSNDVSILLDNRDGYEPAASFAVGSRPWSIAAGDFNKDGKVDLAVRQRRHGSGRPCRDPQRHTRHQHSFHLARTTVPAPLARCPRSLWARIRPPSPCATLTETAPTTWWWPTATPTKSASCSPPTPAASPRRATSGWAPAPCRSSCPTSTRTAWTT